MSKRPGLGHLSLPRGIACGDDDPTTLRDRFVAAGPVDEFHARIGDRDETIETTTAMNPNRDRGLTRKELLLTTLGTPIERLAHVGTKLAFYELYDDIVFGPAATVPDVALPPDALTLPENASPAPSIPRVAP